MKPSTPNAVLATFSDAKAIKGRSVFQIILELPIEQADDALRALGGWPQPSESRWVGVALSKQEREKIEAPAKERKPFHELRPSAQAGIRCGELKFWDWIHETMTQYPTPETTEDCADFIRYLCKVKSRSEFDIDAAAHQRWNLIESGYQAWLTTQKYSEAMR